VLELCAPDSGPSPAPTWTARVHIGMRAIQALRQHATVDHEHLLYSATAGLRDHEHQCVQLCWTASSLISVLNAVRSALEPDSKAKRNATYGGLGPNLYKAFAAANASEKKPRGRPRTAQWADSSQRTKRRRAKEVEDTVRASISAFAGADAEAMEAYLQKRNRMPGVKERLQHGVSPELPVPWCWLC
jgi:hypothetical protein